MTSREQDPTKLSARHFLASLHVCDTIEGLMLAYYDWFEPLITWQNCYRN
jgi:hypothetical protein